MSGRCWARRAPTSVARARRVRGLPLRPRDDARRVGGDVARAARGAHRPLVGRRIPHRTARAHPRTAGRPRPRAGRGDVCRGCRSAARARSRGDPPRSAKRRAPHLSRSRSHRRGGGLPGPHRGAQRSAPGAEPRIPAAGAGAHAGESRRAPGRDRGDRVARGCDTIRSLCTGRRESARPTWRTPSAMRCSSARRRRSAWRAWMRATTWKD